MCVSDTFTSSPLLKHVRTRDLNFAIPSELIAQAPTIERGQSRLMVLTRSSGHLRHCRFMDLANFLREGDMLVLNNSRVLRARLRGMKDPGGSEVEMLLFEETKTNEWWALLRPGKRVRGGTHLSVRDVTGRRTGIAANVLQKNSDGHYLLQFSGTRDIREELDLLGEIPLPPYITRRPQVEPMNDYERYQTVYAQTPGSVAAPTAGLHFTEEIFSRIRARGVQIQQVTLHIGLGTFTPVKAELIEHHIMHKEEFGLGAQAAQAINGTRRSGGRIVAVGTTTARVLEAVAAANNGQIHAMSGPTRIFIYPPYRFQIVDALVTNFHLPRSTLLMLVSAFAAPNETTGRDTILSAYAEAIRERYRFFSYGDAMLIL